MIRACGQGALCKPGRGGQQPEPAVCPQATGKSAALAWQGTSSKCCSLDLETSETPGTQLSAGLSCIAAVPGMLRPQCTGMHEMSLVLHTHNPTPSRQCNACQVLQDPPSNLHDPVAYSLLPARKLLPHTVLAEQWDGSELPEESVLSLPLGQRCETRLQSRAVRKALALECWAVELPDQGPPCFH